MSELSELVSGMRACGQSLVEAVNAIGAFTETLKRCGEKLVEASNDLEAMFSTQQPAAQEPAQQAEADMRKVTIEKVRAVLLDKRRDGHRDEIKALLARYNANKLTEVKAEDYASLLAAAKEIAL